ncbi:MAG: glycosyltransferase, partial [Candidatus Pacebacteria bacterium]|nr:glycosyltransferase [Candidatus Paceibacterota bacterium]
CLSKITNKIIAVSKTVAEFASKQAGISMEKFIVIHNGVEINEIEKYKNSFSKMEARQKTNIPTDSIVFLNVGRINKQKQQHLLVEAFKEVVKENNLAQLYIVGRGGEVEFLKQKVSENNLEDKVVLVGYSDSVSDYYRSADAFVLSSKYEGFPNVAIEAMAFKLPLISTNVPGVDEFLVDRENGFLVDESTESIAHGMIQLLKLSQEELNHMSNEAEKTAQRFDIKETVRKYSELYLK